MKSIVIDVREELEYRDSHVDGAINLPPSDLLTGAKVLDGVNKNTPLILYCRNGTRSAAALHILKDLGFTNLTNGINKENVEKYLYSA